MTDLITIPAADIKPGDVVHIEWTVERVTEVSDRAVIDFPPDGRLFLDPAELLTVTRPDPDADLIERIAQAIWATEGDGEWGGPECHADFWNHYRNQARAALAVMRGEAVSTPNDRASLVRKAADVIRHQHSSGTCHLGVVCGLCDCLDPALEDAYALSEAAAVVSYLFARTESHGGEMEA